MADAIKPETKEGLRTAVVGVTGYAGAELARILLEHPRLNATPLFLGRYETPGEAPAETTRLVDLHPQLSHLPHADELNVSPWTWDTLTTAGIELLFTATPHDQAREWAHEALARGIKLVDLSAAWRLQHAPNRAIYKLEDADPAAANALQHEAVYGSPELHGPAIANARLVANPGCYATSAILALAPLVRANLLDLDRGIVADCKSGVSGSGKAPTAKTHFMYAADNLSAYVVFGHRHTGELLEQLSLTPDQIQFTPHLLPIPRGILSTIYARLSEDISADHIQQLFDDFYATSPTVRIRKTPMLPQIQHIVRSPFCDIGFELSGRKLVLVSCLDNLLKGAASQAIENMNLMSGWPQAEGLI